ncbi:hypothetical protein TNCV_1085821 [Trichonephila clavipes]|nr:hypothetical protein TNCV_1085821 [Trichonephila clavipes]
MPCGTITSSEEYSTAEIDTDWEMSTLTSRTVGRSGAEFGETVRSNYFSKERAYSILRNICFLFVLLDRQS